MANGVQVPFVATACPDLIANPAALICAMLTFVHSKLSCDPIETPLSLGLLWKTAVQQLHVNEYWIPEVFQYQAPVENWELPSPRAQVGAASFCGTICRDIADRNPLINRWLWPVYFNHTVRNNGNNQINKLGRACRKQCTLNWLSGESREEVEHRLAALSCKSINLCRNILSLLIEFN